MVIIPNQCADAAKDGLLCRFPRTCGILNVSSELESEICLYENAKVLQMFIVYRCTLPRTMRRTALTQNISSTCETADGHGKSIC